MATRKTTNLIHMVLALCLALFASVSTEVWSGEVELLPAPQQRPLAERLVDEDDLRSAASFQLVPVAAAYPLPRAREDVAERAFSLEGPVQTAAQDPDARLTARYQNSQMLALLSRISLREVMSLYSESAQLIDTRHVSPTSYEDRTLAALEGVSRALSNPAFLQANRVSPNPQAVAAVQQQLRQMAYSQPARSQQESLGLMQFTAELAQRQLGLRPEAVALEFLNSTIDSLDTYSALMPSSGSRAPGAAAPLSRTANLNENIVGIGVEMKLHPRGAILEGVVEGSPAEQLGLREGDIIVAINQKSIAGQSLSVIADQIGGPVGSTVTLDIDRNGQLLRGTAQRRRFYVSSVSGTKFVDAQNKVGYVRLKQFSESSQEDLEKAMWNLHRQGMQSLILDLRGNPGGLLNESVDVANLFLPAGTIVATRGRTAEDNTQETAKFEKTWAVPLVVLIDENSASASEILAAALQDNGRAIIVGNRSYGKGTVQTHFPLRTISGQLKLTTAKFYAPSGREMAGAGVTPDFAVQTTGYRGTESDAALQTSLQVIAQGIPAQMAQASAAGRAVRFQATNSYSNPYQQPQYQQPQYQQPNFGAGQTQLPRPLPLERGLVER
jgi:carboxyl-terminal processing protease